MQELVVARRREDPLDALSEREREVLGADGGGTVQCGYRASDVGDEGTVEKHVRHILTKLGLAETDEMHRCVLAVITFLQAR